MSQQFKSTFSYILRFSFYCWFKWVGLHFAVPCFWLFFIVPFCTEIKLPVKLLLLTNSAKSLYFQELLKFRLCLKVSCWKAGNGTALTNRLMLSCLKTNMQLIFTSIPLTEALERLVRSKLTYIFYLLAFNSKYAAFSGVRGSKGFTEGEHYWEIRFCEPAWGTSVMIGVGTKDALLHLENNQFVDLLGQFN